MSKREWRHAETWWTIRIGLWPRNYPYFAYETDPGKRRRHGPGLYESRAQAQGAIDKMPGSEGVPVRVLITEA